VAYDVFGQQGSGRVIAELIRRANSTIDFVVISNSLDPELRSMVTWKRAPAPRKPYKAQLAAFWVTGGVQVELSRADLVHVHSIGALIPNQVDLDSVHFCRAGFAAATAARATMLTRFHFWLERRCRTRARLLAALSEGSRRELAELFPDVPCIVAPNGVDAVRFSPDAEARRSLREREGVADAAVVALFVANSWNQKGLGLAIEALGRAAQRGRAPEHLWVVGYGDRDRYSSLAAQHDVEQRVRFFGVRDDIERYYQAADVFVLPTVYEQCCLAAYEAAAAGLAVITTPVHGMEELFGRNECGLIVPRDVSALASAIARVTADAGLRVRFGSEACRRAAAFTWDRSVEAVLDAYRSLGLRF
jgi:glycosyltransferase involved in cell wall biosynthesis